LELHPGPFLAKDEEWLESLGMFAVMNGLLKYLFIGHDNKGLQIM
jgi:hypothetical protein